MNESSPFHEPDLLDTNIYHFEEKGKTNKWNFEWEGAAESPHRWEFLWGREKKQWVRRHEITEMGLFQNHHRDYSRRHSWLLRYAPCWTLLQGFFFYFRTPINVSSSFFFFFRKISFSALLGFAEIVIVYGILLFWNRSCGMRDWRGMRKSWIGRKWMSNPMSSKSPYSIICFWLWLQRSSLF